MVLLAWAPRLGEVFWRTSQKRSQFLKKRIYLPPTVTHRVPPQRDALWLLLQEGRCNLRVVWDGMKTTVGRKALGSHSLYSKATGGEKLLKISSRKICKDRSHRKFNETALALLELRLLVNKLCFLVDEKGLETDAASC